MKTGPLLMTSALVLAAGAAYAKFLRPRILDWNAAPEEKTMAMPGDDVLPDAAMQTTRAITIKATPDKVWPWLMQMGPRPRGGVYTYDWIERLLGMDIRSTDRILPEFQHLAPGDFIGLGEKQGLQVRVVEPERALVLQWVPANSTWTFGLYPRADGSTRLVSRNRLPGSGIAFRLFMAGFMELGSLLMERKMLLGVKQRAEKLAALVPEQAPTASSAGAT